MPYEIKSDHAGCPKSKPFAVVKTVDGELMGCHETKKKAQRQIAALYANEAEVDVSDEQALLECPKGHETHGRGSAGWPGGRKEWEAYHKRWIKKESTQGLLSYHRRLHMVAANMGVKLT
jgi:hypothetical protein